MGGGNNAGESLVIAWSATRDLERIGEVGNLTNPSATGQNSDVQVKRSTRAGTLACGIEVHGRKKPYPIAICAHFSTTGLLRLNIYAYSHGLALLSLTADPTHSEYKACFIGWVSWRRGVATLARSHSPVVKALPITPRTPYVPDYHVMPICT
jgi:hypothetical protein